MKKWLAFLLVLLFAIPFLAYFQKLAPTVYSGDSGDLITAAVTLGIPHPPGYPLYTVLGYLFSLIPVSSPAFRVNLLSAVFQAATIPLVFLIIYRLTKQIIPAVFGSMLLASSFTFWFYAEIAEVFSLNNFLAACLILLAVLIRQKKHQVAIFLFFLTLGLSIIHHQTIALIFPALAILVFSPLKSVLKKQPKRILASLLFFLLGLLPLVYLVLAPKFNSPILWDEPTNISNFLRLITRADYGTFTASKTLTEPAGGRIVHFSAFVQIFLVDFTVLGLILTILGIATAFYKERVLGWFLATGLIISGPVFLMYANFPRGGAFEISVIERFVMLPAIFAAIAASLAVYYLAGFLANNKLVKNLRPAKYLVFAVPLVFLLLPATIFLENWQKIDLSGNYLGKTLAEDILLGLPQDSVVLLRGDTIVFNTQYLHFAENVRPDVKLTGPGVLRADWYYPKQIQRVYPEVNTPASPPDRRILEFVKGNIDKFAIFQFGTPIEIADFVLVPYGLGARLYYEDQVPDSDEIFSQNLKIWQQLKIPQKTGFSDVLFDFSQKIYTEAATRTANFFFSQNDFEFARDFYLKAQEIDDQYLPARSGLALTFQRLGECGEAEKQLISLNLQVPNNVAILEHLIDLYRNCLKNEQMAQIFEDRLQEAKIEQFKLPPLEKF